MSKIGVGLIGTAQRYLENYGENWLSFWENEFANAFFAAKRSILVRFVNLKNWHLHLYQTKLTICLKFMWDL